MTNRTCEFCDKRGLPVMPVRYALSETDGRVPRLAAPMDADKVVTIPGNTKAQYTARLLRSGYLYTYDEARKRWEGYFVTDGGYYLRFDIKQPMSPALAKGRAPCTDEGHQEIASCVTIPDPKHATKVWFGFSDVEWTPAVIKRHEDATYRKRHMRLLDVKAWLGSQQHPHAKALAGLDGTVAEYTRLMVPHRSVFGWSPFTYRNRQGQAENLIKTAAKLAPHGLILGIPDPAGIAQELAAMMAWRTQHFITAPERARQLANLSAIASLEEGIKSQAQHQAIAGVNSYADQIERGPEAVNPSNIATWGMTGDPVQADKVRNMLTAASLDETADKTWAKYKQYFNDGARAEWERTYHKDAKAFAENAIEPLAHAHVAWMKNARMEHYFDTCFDPKNWQASLMYVQVVTACVENTQDKKVCHDLYTDWLDHAQAIDAKNILAKALKFNNKEIEEKIQEVATQALDKRTIPWDGVIGTYKTADEALGKGAADEMARLLVQIAGPAAKVLNRALDGVGGTAFVAIMGGIARSRLEKITYSGKRSEFRRFLIRELTKASGGILTPKQLNQAVLAEMNRLQIRNGRSPDSTMKNSWLVLIDAKTASKAATAEEVAKAIHTVRQLDDLAQHNWRTLMGSSARIGIVSGLLQSVSLMKLLEDDAKAMGHEKKEVAWRMSAGVAVVSGTFAEVSGVMMENWLAARSTLGRGWQTGLAKTLSVGGRVAGVAGGMIMAGWDVVKGYEEMKRHNYGTAILFGGSAFIGVLATAGFYLAWGAAIMFWLIAALVLVVILLELNKPNKLMEWLQRCAWGKGPGNWGSATEDKKQFELALKG